MKRRLAIYACCVALVACGDDERPIDDFVSEPIDVPANVLVRWDLRVDFDVSTDEYASIVRAAEAWTAAMQGLCPVSILVHRAQLAPTYEWPGDGRIDVRVGNPGTGLAGHAVVRAGSGGKILLAPRGPDTPGNGWAFGVAARHELGHIFGLDHSHGGVMQTPASSGITEANARALAAMWCP